MTRRYACSVMDQSRANKGFTLLELMVVVAVIGIIAAIAYPAYTEFIERSRRSEATEALQNLAKLQEQFYYHNKEYSDESNPETELNMPAITENGYYQLQVVPGAGVGGTIQSYTLRATATGAQASDTECAVIQLDSNGVKTPAACW
jgi:type IV pilus assembly protein PilE